MIQVEEEKYVKKYNGVVILRRVFDNLENVDVVKEICEVKSLVKLFLLKFFENVIGLVCVVYDKIIRRGKKLLGNMYRLFQVYDREDFVEKVLIKYVMKEIEYLDEVQKQILFDSEVNRVWMGNVCRGENFEDFEKRS